MGVFLHAQQFETNSANLDIANEFIAWALAHDDVWFVTMSDLVAFMCDPQDIDEAVSFEPFLSSEVSPFDTNEIHYCRYPPSSGFRVCGPCPPDYPSVDNVYYQLSPKSGGAVDVITVEDKTNSFYADMVVTNNSSITSFHWRVTFTVDGGDVTSLWGAEYEIEDDIVYVEPSHDAPPLAPGETNVFGLRVGKDVAFGEVSFPMVDIVMYDLIPTRAVLDLQAAGTDLDMSWDETGFEYRIERRDNLRTSEWVDVSGELYSTNWSTSLPVGNESGFFRLQNFY